MPKQEQTIALNNTDKETALALGYEAMKKLNWTIQFAGENKISGHTPKNWKTVGQQIMIDVENGQLTISSEMVNGEIFDPRGKNKKNVAAFINEFTAAQAAADAAVIENNLTSINTLREVTMQVVKDEIQKAEEVDKAMNLSGSNLNVTYAIMGINVLVFILMAFKGAGIFEPDGYVHVAWGSNYSPLTLSGD
jgi:rhomboid protease GluP